MQTLGSCPPSEIGWLFTLPLSLQPLAGAQQCFSNPKNAGLGQYLPFGSPMNFVHTNRFYLCL